MTEELSYEAERALDPTSIWKRSPLDRFAIDRVLSSAKIPLTVQSDKEEAIRATLALVLDFAIPHILIYPKEANKNQLSEYLTVFGNLVDQVNKLATFRNAPPKPPEDWVAEVSKWATETYLEAPENGSPRKTGQATFFIYLLAFYEFAYQRKPSHTPDGPTFQFIGAVCREMKAAIVDPPWPFLSDGQIRDWIRRHAKSCVNDALSNHMDIPAFFRAIQERMVPNPIH